MLRAKSYKKKLKKSQIKLRKHKTYSIKGGNRNNNSRSKKKQKGGGMIEIDGKKWNTPEEHERYKELKEVIEQRKRSNEEPIEITRDFVATTATTLESPPTMTEQDIGKMVTLLKADLATFDPVSVRDYIKGNIFGPKKPLGYQNLKEIISGVQYSPNWNINKN